MTNTSTNPTDAPDALTLLAETGAILAGLEAMLDPERAGSESFFAHTLVKLVQDKVCEVQALVM